MRRKNDGNVGISSSLAVRVIQGFLFYRHPDLSNFCGFLNWLFATALAGSMARKGIHFAETTTAPRELVFPHKDPETCDKNSLISIAGMLDAFDVVHGIFLQWPVWESVSIRHGFRGADWCG